MADTTAELIARLNPATARLDSMGIGGYGQISQMDVAHAIARINNEGAQLLLLVKHGGQRERTRELERYVSNRFGTRSDIIAHAVREYLEIGRCRRCQGAHLMLATLEEGGRMMMLTHVRMSEGFRVCKICNGSGRHTWQEAERVTLFRDWPRARDKYLDTIGILAEWESEGLKSVRRQMR